MKGWECQPVSYHSQIQAKHVQSARHLVTPIPIWSCSFLPVSINCKILLFTPPYSSRCEICLDRVFIHGPEPCPTCHLTVRKLQFVVPTFEDLNVEKEVRIRSKLTKLYSPNSPVYIFTRGFSFNRQEKDFPTLEEYNDYLEAIEDLGMLAFRKANSSSF